MHAHIFFAKGKQHAEDEIYEHFPNSFFVDTVTFESDCYFSKSEFWYLTDFCDKKTITRDDLLRAIYLLRKKNSLESISFYLQLQDDKTSLHIILSGSWILEKIKIYGILQGAHEFKRLYLLEQGDQFDQEKHLYSCQKIKEYLINDGYHAAHIKDECFYKKATKSVSVHISIIPGKRYCISDIAVSFINTNTCKVKIQHLKNELQRKFAKKLIRAWHVHEDIVSITNECKKYILHNGFLSSDISLLQTYDHEKRTVKLHFSIDISNQAQIFFVGNNFFTQADLLDRIAQFGKSICLLPTELLSEELERMYYDKGFWKVRIESKEDENGIVFSISEGKRARIELVRLVHESEHVEDQKILRRYFRDSVYGYADVQKVDAALYNFIGHYLDKGYISAKIINFSYEPIIDNRYVLVVAFDKGFQAQADEVVLHGLPKKMMQECDCFMQHVKGTILTREEISKQCALLTTFCKDAGYVYARVQPRIVNDGIVSLQWDVTLGPRIFFGKTIITGRPQFSFEKIMKRLFFKEGYLWDQALMHRSLQQLKETNLFDVVQLYPDQTYEEEKKVILLHLQHDDPFELRLRGGFEFEHIKNYQTFAGISYKVGTTLMVKNPLKIGDIFRLDADISGRHREIVAQYTIPVDVAGVSTVRMQGYHILFEHPGFVGSKKNIYTIHQNGFLCGLQKKISYVDFGCNIGVEWQETSINNVQRSSILAAAIDFNQRAINKKIPYLFFEPTIYLTMLDDSLYPHKGLYTLISLKGMAPLKNNSSSGLFFKFHAEQAFFIPFYKIIFATRLRFGHIFYEQFSGINPIERFYLGGSHSVRGYESDLVPPLREFLDEAGKKCIIPRGGKSMINANFEMRYNLFERISVVTFHDIGALSAANFYEKNTYIAHATGFGIRFHTPLGPLRFDIGFKWNRLFKQEERYAWYVTFGHAF